MRTDGIQERISEPEPENAPSGYSAEPYDTTHGPEPIFGPGFRQPLPPNGEPLSGENLGYVGYILRQVGDAVESWDPHHPSNSSQTQARSLQLRKGHYFLLFIEACLVEYMMSKKEEGTVDMVERVEELLEHAKDSLEHQHMA